MASEDRRVDVLLAEYAELKDEQRSRIRVRDNLPYVALGVAGLVATRVPDGGMVWSPLLLLAAALVVLGGVYLRNDEKITDIGAYIGGELAPRLAGLLPGFFVVFGWESAHRKVHGWRVSKALHMALDLVVFCVLPLGALIGYWVTGPADPWLLAVSAVETVGVALIAVQIVRANRRGAQDA